MLPVHLRLRHNALLGATPNRRTAVFRASQSIEKSGRLQWLLPVYREVSKGRGSPYRCRLCGMSLRLDEIIYLECLE